MFFNWSFEMKFFNVVSLSDLDCSKFTIFGRFFSVHFYSMKENWLPYSYTIYEFIKNEHNGKRKSPPPPPKTPTHMHMRMHTHARTHAHTHTCTHHRRTCLKSHSQLVQ